MTLNIKLPVDVVMTARRVYWDSNSNMGLAIIAALEKMVEIGMARKTTGVMYENDKWDAFEGYEEKTNTFPALVICLDAGETIVKDVPDHALDVGHEDYLRDEYE